MAPSPTRARHARSPEGTGPIDAGLATAHCVGEAGATGNPAVPPSLPRTRPFGARGRSSWSFLARRPPSGLLARTAVRGRADVLGPATLGPVRARRDPPDSHHSRLAGGGRRRTVPRRHGPLPVYAHGLRCVKYSTRAVPSRAILAGRDDIAIGRVPSSLDAAPGMPRPTTRGCMWTARAAGEPPVVAKAVEAIHGRVCRRCEAGAFRDGRTCG